MGLGSCLLSPTRDLRARQSLGSAPLPTGRGCWAFSFLCDGTVTPSLPPPLFSTWGDLVPERDTRQCQRHFLVDTNGGRPSGIQAVERAGNVLQGTGQLPVTKTSLARNAMSAEGEKPCCSLSIPLMVIAIPLPSEGVSVHTGQTRKFTRALSGRVASPTRLDPGPCLYRGFCSLVFQSMAIPVLCLLYHLALPGPRPAARQREQ